MPLTRAHRPFRWWRRILLTVGLLLTAGLVALLLTPGPGEEGERPRIASGGSVSDGAVALGRGFDYTQTTAGERVFRLQAEERRHDRSGVVELERVKMTVYRSEGEVLVWSERGRYDPRTGAARLEGDVRLEGWQGIELKAPALTLLEGGQTAVSEGAVRFRLPPDLEGRASSLQAYFPSESLLLGNGVHVRSVEGVEPALSLDGERLTFQGEQRFLRAHGKVVLRRGRDVVRSTALTAFLLEDRRKVGSLRARWDVRSEIALSGEPGDERVLEIEGDLLDILLDPETSVPRKIELEGEHTVAQIRLRELSGLTRRMRGRYVTARLVDGSLQRLEGYGAPLVLSELLDLPQPFYLRRLCARRAEARFDADGALSALLLRDDIDLQDLEVQFSGAEDARFFRQRGVMEIAGDEVRLRHRAGELLAPHYGYNPETGLLRAGGGVRANLVEEALAGLGETPLAEGQGPVHVESAEANWTRQPAAFAFLGDVRAWRGQNLLLADQLRGDATSGQLSASGDVRSLWRTGVGIGGLPVEVTARFLSYGESPRELRYQGDVEVRQGQQLLSCSELTIELVADGRDAEAMRCHGEVSLADLVNGRTVTGELAVYTLADELVEVYGDPVELRDSLGNRVDGRYLRYEMGSGELQLSPSPPPAGPAPAR